LNCWKAIWHRLAVECVEKKDPLALGEKATPKYMPSSGESNSTLLWEGSLFLDAVASVALATRTIGFLNKGCLSYSTSATRISDNTVTSIVYHTDESNHS
jgi:hypothetical protein